MFEHRAAPLLSKKEFLGRVFKYALLAAFMLSGSLGLGVLRFQPNNPLTLCAKLSEAVSPGESIPTRLMKPGKSSRITKSFSSVSAGLRSFGRMPQVL